MVPWVTPSAVRDLVTRPTRRRGLALLVAAAPILLLAACAGGQTTPPDPTLPAATPTSVAEALHSEAESSYLPYMTPALQSVVREQPWYQQLTPLGLDLVAAIQRCERAAHRNGQPIAVAEILKFASEQAWYTDGLDDRETKALTAAFRAYLESLNDDNAPAIGPVLAPTLRHGLFEVVALDETGEMVLLLTATDAATGAATLASAVDALPRVEAIVGAFPYEFLHIQITPLPAAYAGLSYNEFIALSPDWLDQATIVHEITHSTLYGIFPLWFEEGLAHFIEYYLAGTLEDGVSESMGQLHRLGRDARLDLRPTAVYSSQDQLAERAQGFLLIKSIFDIQGIEGLSSTIRALRTQTFGDQDLLRTIVGVAPPAQQERLNQLLCDRVLGTTRDYCAPQP